MQHAARLYSNHLLICLLRKVYKHKPSFFFVFGFLLHSIFILCFLVSRHGASFFETANLFLLCSQVDRSIVESFVQGGRTAITARVYPRTAVDNLANLYLFNNGTNPITVRSLAAYQMSHVVMHPI
jgi:hypothetical protein